MQSFEAKMGMTWLTVASLVGASLRLDRMGVGCRDGHQRWKWMVRATTVA